MAADIQNLKEKFESLSARERNIILILGLVLITFIFDQLVLSPLQTKNKKTEQQMTVLASQMNEQNAQMNTMMTASKQDPNLALKQKRDRLQQSIELLDTKIDKLTTNMIPPKQMTEVLEGVLRQNTRLTLLKVNTLPVQKVVAENPARKNQIRNQESSDALFRHSVEIELQGGYFDTLKYLQAIEALPWQMLWSELDYRVEEYPKAHIRLKLNTLSTSANWIGA